MMSRLLVLLLIMALCYSCSASRHSTSESHIDLETAVTEADSTNSVSTHDVASMSATDLLTSFSGLRLIFSADSIITTSGLVIHKPTLSLTADSASTDAHTLSQAEAHDSTAATSSTHISIDSQLIGNRATQTDTEVKAPELPAWIDWTILGGVLLLILSFFALGLRFIRRCVPNV